MAENPRPLPPLKKKRNEKKTYENIVYTPGGDTAFTPTCIGRRPETY